MSVGTGERNFQPHAGAGKPNRQKGMRLHKINKFERKQIFDFPDRNRLTRFRIFWKDRNADLALLEEAESIFIVVDVHDRRRWQIKGVQPLHNPIQPNNKTFFPEFIVEIVGTTEGTTAYLFWFFRRTLNNEFTQKACPRHL